MAEFFPAELPNRPSKLPFTKRLSHKFKPQKGKGKQSRSVSSSVSSATNYLHVASPGSCAQESHVTDHVRTRRITSQPAPRVLLKARPETPQSDLVQPGRNFSIVSLAFPEPHIEYPTSAHASSYDPGLVEEQRDVPRLHRKEPPQLTVRDALVERFGKLRLPATSTHAPLTPAEVPLCRSPTNFSFPLQSSNSTKAANLAWNRMAVSNPILPSFREQPHSHTNQLDANRHRQTQNSMEPIVIDDDSEHDATAGPNRPTSNFENTNFFQSGRLSRQSLNRRRTRRDRCLRKKPDRRNQSPSASSFSSEGNLTPDSSESSESDLSARVAQVGSSDSIRATTRTRGLIAVDVNPDRNAQEEQDRLLAQHLQGREDEMYATTPAQLAERTRSSAPQAASPETLSQKPGLLGSLRRDITHIGTREDPVNLESDSDDPGTAVPERARIQDYVALYGEPMEIDGMSPFDAPRTANAYADERTHLRNRDCVVCGDSIHVIDLPSLANCDHRPETCADCYSGWITAQLQGSSWREAKCPGNKCKVVLSYHEIQLYANPETFQQYDTFIAGAAFSEDPNFRWCRVCDSGQIHMSGVESNIFTCVACGYKVCIIHENTWHEGETCGEFEYRTSGRKERDQRAQEEASLKAIGKLTKKCPGPGCTWNIEKNDGCDHMTCSKCRYEFCWSCLCNYNNIRRVGNSAHATTCKYHTGRLV